MGEGTLKEFILPSVLLASVHFWDRVQKREEGGTDSRTAAQLGVPPYSINTQKHRKRHTYLNRLDSGEAVQSGRQKTSRQAAA